MRTQKGITLKMHGQPVQMTVGMHFQCVPKDYDAYVSGILRDMDRHNLNHQFGTKTCKLESLPTQGVEKDEEVLLTVLFLGEDESVQIAAGDLLVLNDAEQFV